MASSPLTNSGVATIDCSLPFVPRRESITAEATIAAVAFALGTLLVFAPHVVQGGWYADDWMLLAGLEHRTGSVLSAAGALSYRPGYSTLLAAMYLIAGRGQAAYLAIGAAIVGAQCWLFYLCLRRLDADVGVSAVAAALLLVMPFVDGARLWLSAFASSAAVALTFLGLLAALRGLRAPRRRDRIACHAAALAVWFAAMLTYESVAPLLACSLFVYIFGGAPWQTALKRWAVDLAMITVAGISLRARASDLRASDFTPDYLWLHFRQSWTATNRLLAHQLPLGNLWWGPLGVLMGLIAAVGTGLALTDPQARHLARQALLMASGGLALAIVGYVAILPAGGYFIPNESGAVSRVLAASAPGLALLLTGAAAVVAVGYAKLMRRSALNTPFFATASIALIGTFFAHERSHQRVWADAWVIEQKVVSAARHTIHGPLRPGDAVVSFRHPFALTPGDIPSFGTWWDLRGAMELTFHTHDLQAVPWTPQYSCGLRGMDFNFPPGTLDDPPMRGIYGHLWFVDPAAYKSTLIRSQRQCSLAVNQLSVSAPISA